MHSNADWGEGMRAIEVIMEHEELKAALKKLKLPKGTVVIPEPWLYGLSILSIWRNLVI
jgi:primary-amine oxidase